MKRNEKSLPTLLRRVCITEGCWIWTGAVCSSGYGNIRIAGKLYSTHRLSWELHNGNIPHGMHVLHKCDNPPCVNPEHLFLGTNDDNMADKVDKGRAVAKRGSENTRSKLTESDVLKIREGRSIGRSISDMAAEYGVSISLISQITLRRVWKHV